MTELLHCLTGNAVQRKRVLTSVGAGCDLDDPCRGEKHVHSWLWYFYRGENAVERRVSAQYCLAAVSWVICERLRATHNWNVLTVQFLATNPDPMFTVSPLFNLFASFFCFVLGLCFNIVGSYYHSE